MGQSESARRTALVMAGAAVRKELPPLDAAVWDTVEAETDDDALRCLDAGIGLAILDLDAPDARRVAAAALERRLPLICHSLEDSGFEPPAGAAYAFWRRGSGSAAFRSALAQLEERRRLEAALAQRSEAVRCGDLRLDSVLTAVPLGIGVVRNRTILEVNEWIERMLGYSADELRGRDTRFLYASDAEYLRAGEVLGGALGSGAAAELETVFRRKDGIPLEVLLRGVAFDDGQAARGITFAVLDLSRSKRLERELEARLLSLAKPLEDLGLPAKAELDPATLARLLASLAEDASDPEPEPPEAVEGPAAAERYRNIHGVLSFLARLLAALANANAVQARAIADRARAQASLEEVDAQLRRALEEKDALYRELKHRVKNGMALMASLVGLEASHADDDALREVLDSTRARIESLANLYDLLGRHDNPNAVRMDQYMERIIASLTHSLVIDGSGVEFRTRLEPLEVHSRTAAPLGLVAMELIVNSLKHAFPAERRGAIFLAVYREGAELVMEIADDGVGLPAGFDEERDGGLGLELVRLLAMQMKAKGEFAAAEAGTRFVLRVVLA